MFVRKSVFLFALCLISLSFAQPWESIGPSGTKVTQVLPDPDSSNSIYIATLTASEPGTKLERTSDAGAFWSNLGMYNSAAFHPATAETIFATLGMGSTVSDGIWRSDDYGTTFPSPPPTLLFMAKGVTYDLTDYNYLFGWGGEIVRSTDAGMTWTSVYSPTLSVTFLGVTVDPTANHRVWAWDDGGQLYLSTDHGLTWVVHHVFTESFNPNDLAVAPDDTAIIYLATWGGVVKSTDCGTTWDTIPMPSPPSNCIWVSEISSYNVVVGGAYGLRFSTNGGTTWEMVGDSIPHEVLDFAVGPDSSGGHLWYVATDAAGVLRREAIPFSEGPVVSYQYPPDSACVSLDSIQIHLRIIDPDGLDSASVSFVVNGSTYVAADHELTVTDTGVIFEDDFASGDTVEITLDSVDDLLGHSSGMVPFNWCFFVDRDPPQLLYRYPDADEVVDTGAITAKFYAVDYGCGLDMSSCYVRFDSVTVYSSSMAFLYEYDTIYIYLPAAGVVINHGDTIQVTFHIEDSITVGEPNEITVDWSFTIEATGIKEALLPGDMELLISPNPFNASCRIEAPGDVEIYDIYGRRVREISKDASGILWDGTDYSGKPLPSGIYFVKDCIGRTEIGKAILLR